MKRIGTYSSLLATVLLTACDLDQLTNVGHAGLIEQPLFSSTAASLGGTNEPTGFVVFAEHSFDGLPPAGGEGSGPTIGPGIIHGFWTRKSAQDANYSTVSDGTAPASSPGVFRQTYPTGMNGGTAPGKIVGWDAAGSGTVAEKRSVYLLKTFKINGPDFEMPGSGFKLGYFGFGKANGNNQGALSVIQTGNFQSEFALKFSNSLQGTNFPMNENTATRALAGTWHRLEMLLELNDIGSDNGTLQVWLDGVRILNYANLRYRDAANPHGFQIFRWPGTADGGSTKTRDDHIDLDHLYLSGLNVGEPDPPIPPAVAVKWWRPVVPVPEPIEDVFNGSLAPEVEICELDGGDCAFSLVVYNMSEVQMGGIVEVRPGEELYRVVFRTWWFGLDVNKFYRITVREGGEVLRMRDIDLVSDQAEADAVDQDQYTPIINGSAFQIRFRLEGGDTGDPGDPPDEVAPTANQDAYTTEPDTPISRATADADDLLDNDDLGDPAATIVSFGGGRVGGNAASNPAGTTVSPLPQGSGSLTVNADGSFSFTPPTGFSGNYRFSYKLQNSAGFTTARVTITVQPPATATNDSYTASGNIQIALDAANGVLGNDGGPTTVTTVQGSGANVGTSTATTAVGRNGVTGFVKVNADGSFTYEPPPGYEGTDTFTYGISGSSATVSIVVSKMVWFIQKNATSSTRIGTFSNPFRSIEEFNTANAGTGAKPDPKPGDLIALRKAGIYSENDGINLLNNQKLIGEAVAFNTAFTADPNSSAAYQTFAAATNSGPVIEVTGAGNNGIDLATNNTVRGLTIGDVDVTPLVPAFGMAGNLVGNLVVNAVSITGLGGALDLKDGTFGSNVVFDELSAITPSKEGIRIRTSSGTLAVTNPASTIVGTQGGQSVRIGGGSLTMNYPGSITHHEPRHMVEITNTTGGTITFSGTVSQAHSGGKGVKIAGVAGDIRFFDLDLGTAGTRNGGPGAGILIEPFPNPGGSFGPNTGTFTFDDVNIFVTGAANAGVRVDNTAPNGKLVIKGGTINGAGGAPAIDVELVELSLVSTATSVSSSIEGIRMSGVTGGVNLTGASVSGAGADGFSASSRAGGTFCLNLASSSSAGSGAGFALNSAAGTFRLQNFTGNGADPADVSAWVAGKGNTGTTSVTGTSFTAAPGACVP